MKGIGTPKAVRICAREPHYGFHRKDGYWTLTVLNDTTIQIIGMSCTMTIENPIEFPNHNEIVCKIKIVNDVTQHVTIRPMCWHKEHWSSPQSLIDAVSELCY